MLEEIRRNKRRSQFLIVFMGLLLLAVGAAGGIYIDPQLAPFGMLVAAVIWFFMTLIAYFQGDSILLGSVGGRKIEKADAPQLWNIVEEMTIASGMGGTMPAVYIIDDNVPNAFAVGRNPKKAAVAVTSGLLKRLNRDELQGVIAHELAHIKNLDIRFMMLASVMMGAIVLLSDIVIRNMFYGGGRRRRSSSSDGGGQAQVIMIVVALVVIIVAPIAARMLYFACSRRREYLADASAARYTRYPAGLASALRQISKNYQAPPKNVSRNLAPLYIINPLQAVGAAGLFSTHPPTELRIKILESMSGGAHYAAYEEAYQNVTGKKSCLGASALTGDEQVTVREASKDEKEYREAVMRMRGVNDLFNAAAGFAFLTCTCGLRFKTPPDLKKDRIPCPRCGTTNFIPTTSEPKPEAETLTYIRKTDGWESVHCQCGKTITLSPAVSDTQIECTKCNRKINVQRPQ